MSDAAVPQPTRQGSVRERILRLEESIGSPTSAEINRFEASAARAIAHRLSRSPSSEEGLRLALLDLAGSRRSSEAPATPERFEPAHRVQGLPSLGTVPRSSATHQSPQSTPTTPTSRNKRDARAPRDAPETSSKRTWTGGHISTLPNLRPGGQIAAAIHAAAPEPPPRTATARRVYSLDSQATRLPEPTRPPTPPPRSAMSPLKAPDASRTGPTPPPRRRLSAPRVRSGRARLANAADAGVDVVAEPPEPPPPPPRSSTRLSQAAPPTRTTRTRRRRRRRRGRAGSRRQRRRRRRKRRDAAATAAAEALVGLSSGAAAAAAATSLHHEGREGAANGGVRRVAGRQRSPAPATELRVQRRRRLPAVGGRLFDDLLSAVPTAGSGGEHALERGVIGAGPPAQDSPKGYDPGSPGRRCSVQTQPSASTSCSLTSESARSRRRRRRRASAAACRACRRGRRATRRGRRPRSRPRLDGIGDELGDDWLAGNPSPASSASSGGRQAAVPPLLSPRSSGRQASSSPQTVEPEVRDAQLQWMYRQESDIRQERKVVAARADRSLDCVLQEEL